GLLIGSYNLMIEEYVSGVYHMASWGMSALYVAEGLVSACLGIWMANRKFFFKRISSYGIMYAMIGVSWVLFGLSRNLFEGAICLILFALFSAFTAPYERITMQQEVPTETRGRVFGLWTTVAMSALQVGAFFTGIIISAVGLTYVPLVIGGIQMMFGLLFLLFVRRTDRNPLQMNSSQVV
ncbi:MAG TPA: MFS transporter, partial [Bacilli bacterium]|nr:MFS transporter [Bacilli bacterium]